MQKKNLWIYSFEFAGIKKVGGLGEVPTNHVKWLKDDINNDLYNITLFMPSHGVHKDPKIIERLSLEKIESECVFRFKTIASDRAIETDVFENDGDKIDQNEKVEDIRISYYKGSIYGITTIILAGNNEYSSKIMEDPVVYSMDRLSEKIILFSNGIKYYVECTIDKKLDLIPNIIHCHDYHGIPALINTKQALNKIKINPATIFTIHLMTRPQKSINFLFECGIENTEMDVFLENRYQTLNISKLFDFCQSNCSGNPTLEMIGAYISDIVITVSKNYLNSTLIPELGIDFLKNKTEFIHNGCDWDYDEMMNSIKKEFHDDLFNLNQNKPYSHNNLRKLLLTSIIGNLPEDEPKLSSENVKTFLSNTLSGYPYKMNSNGKYLGKIFPFKEDGPLIMMTGRISNQKGIDILISAIPNVLTKYPDVRFLFLLMPLEFSIPEIKGYLDSISKYKENVRCIFGKVYSSFALLHLAADLYCIPSRWEPFGLVALEAMSLGVPVIGSNVGGISETVIDYKTDPENGTGLLIPTEQPFALSNAINEFLELMNNNPEEYNRIRNNGKKRVDSMFRWKSITKKLNKVYEKALLIRERAI